MPVRNEIKDITPCKKDRQSAPKTGIPNTRPAENRESLKKTTVPEKNVRKKHIALKEKARAYDTLVSKKEFSLRTFCRRLRGVNTNKIYSDLYALGYLYKEKGIYRVYSAYRDVLFAECCSEGNGNQDIMVLDKGKLLLVELHNNGKLSMKKTYVSN